MLRGGQKKNASYRVSSNCLGGGGPHTNQMQTLTTNVKLQYHCSIMKKSKGVNMCINHIWPFKSAHEIPNYTRVSASKTRARPGIIFQKYMNMMFKIAEKGHLLSCIMEI